MLILVSFALTVVAWRRYLWAAAETQYKDDACPYSLTDSFDDNHLVNVPHQKGIKWLTEVFSRSAEKFPDLPALQIPHTGETLTFSELDARAESIATAVSQYLSGPDQVVAVAMSQDNWHIVASHLGVLKAGGTLMFLDTSVPDTLLTHMLDDARPVVVLTRGPERFRDLPTLDVLTLPESAPRAKPPSWLDDPAQRLATIFYTSGTTGMPKGVECPHAGYVNLALSYADYFDLVPGMDATSLTSSLGYDGSISEMYSAWVSGCAVVMLTKEQMRSGPDLVPILRDAEVTVLFCPPVLLTTLTPAPEIDLPYPLCRYIVPAGEAFPSTLVEPWTRGRRQIINTYGPTEASTDTSRQSLRPGEPITIGSPFANVTYVILEVGGLTPLPHGEAGELCIGGIHVARGYRNLPEQTAEKFIQHPKFGRLYRTGDRCRIDIGPQRVHFLGRIDTQLKVRGHRVETQAVEDILQTQFNEIEAAVLDYQNDALVAFVVAPSIANAPISEVAPAPPEWQAHVTAILAKQLPTPSVPTRILLVEKFFMMPISGKIDRALLPKLSSPSCAAATADLGLKAAPGVPRVAAEAQADAPDPDPFSQEVLAICREVLELPLQWDDGFAASGAHSIAIARLAQRLHAAGLPVTVRSLLTDCNTARKVAGRTRQYKRISVGPAPPVPYSTKRAERDEAATEVLSVGSFTALQLLFAALIYSPGLAALVGIVGSFDIGELFMTAGPWEFILAGLALYGLALLTPFVALLWVMAIKLVLGGDCYRNGVTPGIYPKWSRMHLRIWCIGRLEALVLVPMRAVFRSAPLVAFALRQLGADVGANLQCAYDAAFSGPLDLITIGDDVTIQTGAYIHTVIWTGETLTVGEIRLNDSCKIGMRAAVAPDVTVDAGTWITPFTPVLRDTGAHEIWEGAPARRTGRCIRLRRPADTCRPILPHWLLETANILAQIFLNIWLSLVPVCVIVWWARSLIPEGAPELASAYFEVTPFYEVIWHLTVYTFITTWGALVATSILKCLFLRCTAFSPGVCSPRGLTGALLMFRLRVMNTVQRRWTWTITGQYLRALAGVRFARLGASECDVMFNLVPELASADSKVFWSNGCFTNMLDYGAEHIALRRLDMPRNFFSGNNCVAEYGQFPSNFLLGVSTPASEIEFRRQMRSRAGQPITAVGNPPVRFSRARPEEDDPAKQLPGFPLFLTRVFVNDVLSIGLLPVAELLVFALCFIGTLRLDIHPVAGAAVAVAAAEMTMVLVCIAVKRALVGSHWGRDDTTHFWSWGHFAYFFAQDCFFAWCSRPLRLLAGTVLANNILRAMGCRIGRRTIVTEPMQSSDWNAVDFGKDCIIAGFLQFHTIEDMTLRVKTARILDGSAVNFGATVMGGTVIERDTTLMPLSLVLKEMALPTATYEGSPAESSGGPARPPALAPRAGDFQGLAKEPAADPDDLVSSKMASDGQR